MEKIKVLYVHESIIASILKDTVTFGFLFALWFFNHRFCGGSWIIDFFVGIMVFIGALGLAKKRYYPKEAAAILAEIARQETLDTAKTSNNTGMDAITLKDLDSYSLSFSANILNSVCHSTHAISQFIKFIEGQRHHA